MVPPAPTAPIIGRKGHQHAPKAEAAIKEILKDHPNAKITVEGSKIHIEPPEGETLPEQITVDGSKFDIQPPEGEEGLPPVEEEEAAEDEESEAPPANAGEGWGREVPAEETLSEL